MKHPTFTAQRLRFTLAFAATGASINICALEHHFTLSPTHPSTWPVMLDHKCGILFLLCFAWLRYEMLRITMAFRSRVISITDL